MIFKQSQSSDCFASEENRFRSFLYESLRGALALACTHATAFVPGRYCARSHIYVWLTAGLLVCLFCSRTHRHPPRHRFAPPALPCPAATHHPYHHQATFFALRNSYRFLTPNLWKESALVKAPFAQFSDQLRDAEAK